MTKGEPQPPEGAEDEPAVTHCSECGTTHTRIYLGLVPDAGGDFCWLRKCPTHGYTLERLNG